LCAEFKVSRSPVREALQMLADRRLVEKTPRQGYVVRQLNLTEIHELYDLRLVLETHIMEQVCKTGMDEATLAALKQRWTQVYEALPEMIADPVTVDENFHQALARAVGNRAMAEMLANIDARIRFVRMFDITNAERLKATCLQHLETLEAIERRDAGKAIDFLRHNIEGGRTQAENAVKEALASAHAIYG
jgi:DNA-binding GntR family transcriptional regulator